MCQGTIGASGSLGLHWLWAGPEPPEPNPQQGGCTWSPCTESSENLTSSNSLYSKSYKSSVTRLRYPRSRLSQVVRVETAFTLHLQRDPISVAYSALRLSVVLARPAGTAMCGRAGSLIWLISRGKILCHVGLNIFSLKEKLRGMKQLAQDQMASRGEERC